MAIETRKAAYHESPSGSSISLAFAETPALDSTHLLVAFVSFIGAGATVSSTSWGGTAKYADNQGSTRMELWIKQADGSTNDFTANLSVAASQREIILFALNGYSSEAFDVAPWTLKSGTAVTSVDLGPNAAGTVSANTIAVAAIMLTGTPSAAGVDWGNFTNGFTQLHSRLSQQRSNVALQSFTTTGAQPSTSVSWDPLRTRAYVSGIFMLRGTSADAGADTTDPEVSITAPLNGATVSDITTLTITATDDVAVSSVTAEVGGGVVGTFTNTAGTTWELDLDTTAFEDGDLTIDVNAYDAADNIGTASVTVTVHNVADPVPSSPTAYLGTIPLDTIRTGTTEISRAYYGTELLWGSLPVEDPEPASGIFGPDGTHWPSFTPLRDASFVYDVEVDPTWSAISNAIVAAPSAGNARIRVRPGTLPLGNGANSTDTGVLQDIGTASRSSRILVTPRDGYGTVVGQGAIADGASVGYAFVNVCGVTFHGFDWSGQVVNFRNCRNSAAAWSTIGLGNIVANGASGVDSFQFVEVVAATQLDDEADRMAVRTGSTTGNTINNLSFIGCYLAPVYKASGSSAHCDTFQFSGSGGSISNVLFQDTIFFQSSSQVVMCERLTALTVSHTALIGGQRAIERYPIGGDRHVIISQNTLWGGSSDAVVTDSYILGSVSSGHSFSSVSNTIVPQAVSATVESGAFTVDTDYASSTTLPAGWLDTNAPLPDGSRLSTIWA